MNTISSVIRLNLFQRMAKVADNVRNIWVTATRWKMRGAESVNSKHEDHEKCVELNATQLRLLRKTQKNILIND